MGSTDQSESQDLVSEGSREKGRGQGRGHHRGTEKGRWRSQARGRTVRCFYCDQEGHIKRDCPKYKAHDQSSDTAAIAVMAVDESEVLLAASDDGKSDWWRNSQSFQGKQGDAVLQSYGGDGSEAVRKDYLKISDYPPVGWRGRLLSPAHLDESKPTWMSPSPVAKPKPDWSSYGVSM
ncbi:hypothetical protein Acr_07g0006000 [Actinidia rufa]|uniref:CCHC-type domain-containing protein n=1 Tax=Actinidia rufa TaxID=165716 RepID=A0A7J0EVG9_9ERIC|nr:hypothetical protein Acr_07g0006000 [Actinidia rufa]